MAKLAEKMNDESYDDEQDEEYPALFEDPFNALVSELVDEEDEEDGEEEEDVDEEEDDDDDDDNAAAAVGVKPKLRRARDE